MARIGLLGGLLAATLLAGATHAGISTEEAPLRVLFIGSSGTTSNDLPARVAEFAGASGRKLRVPNGGLAWIQPRRPLELWRRPASTC